MSAIHYFFTYFVTTFKKLFRKFLVIFLYIFTPFNMQLKVSIIYVIKTMTFNWPQLVHITHIFFQNSRYFLTYLVYHLLCSTIQSTISSSLYWPAAIPSPKVTISSSLHSISIPFSSKNTSIA